MTKTQTSILSFIVPIAGIVIFFNMLNKDKPAAFNALVWAMLGLALALALLVALGLGTIINIGMARA
jgi:hypothetical protein